MGFQMFSCFSNLQWMCVVLGLHSWKTRGWEVDLLVDITRLHSYGPAWRTRPAQVVPGLPALQVQERMWMTSTEVSYPIWAVKWQWSVCKKCQTQVIGLQPINRRWHIFTAHIIVCQQMRWGEREPAETVHLVALFVLIIKQGKKLFN